jgi:hypothetical protein
LISGVMTGVTAGAVGFIGAASLIGGLRAAAFLLAGFFFFALRAGRLFAALFFDFLATRFLVERFLAERFFDDFFLDFLEVFFFAFFFAAMWFPFNVDRLSVVRAARRADLTHYQAFGFASKTLVKPNLWAMRVSSVMI